MLNWWEGERGERNIIDNIESLACSWQVTDGESWVYQVLLISWLEYVAWKAVQLHASICCSSQFRIIFSPLPLSAFILETYFFHQDGKAAEPENNSHHTLYRAITFFRKRPPITLWVVSLLSKVEGHTFGFLAFSAV